MELVLGYYMKYEPNYRKLFISRKVLMVETWFWAWSWFWAQNVQKMDFLYTANALFSSRVTITSFRDISKKLISLKKCMFNTK